METIDIYRRWDRDPVKKAEAQQSKFGPAQAVRRTYTLVYKVYYHKARYMSGLHYYRQLDGLTSQ